MLELPKDIQHEIESSQQVIRDLLDAVKTMEVPEFIKQHIYDYLTIKISGHLDFYIGKIATEIVLNHYKFTEDLSGRILRYDRITNLNSANLLAFISQFGMKYARALKDNFAESQTSLLNELVKVRNGLAHGNRDWERSGSNPTITKVEQYFETVTQTINFITYLLFTNNNEFEK